MAKDTPKGSTALTVDNGQSPIEQSLPLPSLEESTTHSHVHIDRVEVPAEMPVVGGMGVTHEDAAESTIDQPFLQTAKAVVQGAKEGVKDFIHGERFDEGQAQVGRLDNEATIAGHKVTLPSVPLTSEHLANAALGSMQEAQQQSAKRAHTQVLTCEPPSVSLKLKTEMHNKVMGVDLPDTETVVGKDATVDVVVGSTKGIAKTEAVRYLTIGERKLNEAGVYLAHAHASAGSHPEGMGGESIENEEEQSADTQDLVEETPVSFMDSVRETFSGWFGSSTDADIEATSGYSSDSEEEDLETEATTSSVAEEALYITAPVVSNDFETKAEEKPKTDSVSAPKPTEMEDRLMDDAITASLSFY